MLLFIPRQWFATSMLLFIPTQHCCEDLQHLCCYLYQHNIAVEDLQHLCCYLYQTQHPCWGFAISMLLFIPKQHPWGFATSVLIIYTKTTSLMRVCNIYADYFYQPKISVEGLQHLCWLCLPTQHPCWGFATPSADYTNTKLPLRICNINADYLYLCKMFISLLISHFYVQSKIEVATQPWNSDIFLISLWLPCLQSGSQTMVTKPSVLAFTVEMCYTQQQLTEGHTHWDRHYEKKIKSLLSKYHAWLWHLHESLTQTFCEEFSTEKILNYLKATDIFVGIYIFRSYQLRLCFIYTSF